MDDLRDRLVRTRWPEPEPVGDWSQGVPLRRLRELCRYWADGYDWRVTGTAASSARLYWESINEVAGWFTAGAGDTIAVPTGAAVFPAEVPRPSRRWAERRFTDIVHWAEPDRGGHFAAWEQPELFVADLRATVRALRRRR